MPRSYTLPREFKYYRRNKARKFYKNDHFITSTNSSDGDVDSGDDNESEQHSNLSNNSQQHCLRLQPQSVSRKNAPYSSATQNKASIIRNQYHHCGISASATTSPVTVSNIFVAKEINKLKGSLSPHLTAAMGSPTQVNLKNNLHVDALNSSNNANCAGAVIDNVVDRETTMSPSIALNLPNSMNYLNRLPNSGSTTDIQPRNRLTSPSCNMLGNTLDLISGVESPTTVTAINRQMRLRAYSNYKNGLVRHETKL